jgi:hypothetical protein
VRLRHPDVRAPLRGATGLTGSSSATQPRVALSLSLATLMACERLARAAGGQPERGRTTPPPVCNLLAAFDQAAPFAMTQYPATRAVATQPSSSSGGLDLKTLLITAVSSAAAAFACSKLWAPGTLAAAAFTPVLVALIREGLSKSTAVVVRAVPVRGVVRSAPPPGGSPDPGGDWSAADLPGAAPAGEPASRVPQPGQIAYHGATRSRRNWRVAIVTGLLGFVVAAVLFTVPELLAGESASGGGRGTTIFGGTQRERAAPAVTTTTTTAPARTVTTPEEETVTVPPETVTTPPPTVTTPQTTPTPTTTTAPPPVAEPPPAEVPPG